MIYVTNEWNILIATLALNFLTLTMTALVLQDILIIHHITNNPTYTLQITKIFCLSYLIKYSEVSYNSTGVFKFRGQGGHI